MGFTRHSPWFATLLIGQCVLAASEDNSDTADGIMPESVARTGEFQVSFSIKQLLGRESSQRYQDMLSPDEPIEWKVYVPESYSSERPAGVLVYISPSQTGSIPNHWKSLMDEHNLIWIGANKSGNRVLVPRRMTYALMAPAVIDKNYAIDIHRVYLSGFSGGGRAASIVAVQYPQIFRGAIFNCGADFWGEDPPQDLELVKTNRYVFLTGSNDHNLEPTKKAFRGFQSAGILNSKLMVIRDMGHTNPKRRDFDKAIAFLDDEGVK